MSRLFIVLAILLAAAAHAAPPTVNLSLKGSDQPETEDMPWLLVTILIPLQSGWTAQVQDVGTVSEMIKQIVVAAPVPIIDSNPGEGEGEGECAYTVAPTTVGLPAAASSNNTVTVTTDYWCDWTGVSNDGWLTVTYGAAGSGNGEVRYDASENTGVERVGTLTVAGDTVTVTQSAAPGEGEGEGEGETVAGWVLDANGWIDLSAVSWDYTVYCSESIGNDSYDGYSGTDDGGGVGPKATLAAACNLANSLWGNKVRLLLKRGDDWGTGEVMEFWGPSGSSQSAPTFVGAYGTGDRPVVRRIDFKWATTHHVVMADLQTMASMVSTGSYNAFENMWYGGTEYFIDQDGGTFNSYDEGIARVATDNAFFNRCIFDDHIIDDSANSKQGLYIAEKSGLYIHKSYFHGAAGRTPEAGENWTTNQHLTYIHANQADDTTLDGCVAFRGPNSAGFGMRAGGTMVDCLGYSNGGGLGISYPYPYPEENVNGVDLTAYNNVVLSCPFRFRNGSVAGVSVHDNIIQNAFFGTCSDVSGGNARTRGGVFADNIAWNCHTDFRPYNEGDITPDYTFTNMVVRRRSTESYWRAFSYTGTYGWVTTTGCVYNNGDAGDGYLLSFNGTPSTAISDYNTNFSTTATTTLPSYVDPGRGMMDYLNSLALGPYSTESDAWDAFVVLMRAQDRGSWNTAYEAEAINAYIRAGFEESP